MNLVIVESPAKAKTIEKYLGKGYKVMATVGHIIDLPKSKLSVDVENGFAPEFVTIKGKGKVVSSLKKAVPKDGFVMLAMDPDREGEAIAYHTAQALKLKDAKRVVFHEITKGAVTEAIKNPRNIDENLVDAQFARRVLDRLVGYKVSELLWRKVWYGLSAGRVQSVALRLIVEREDEIDAFVPVEFWDLFVNLKSKAGEALKVKLSKKDGKKFVPSNETEVIEIKKDVEGKEFEVTSVNKKELKKHAPPPFTTSTMQQSSNSFLGLSAKRTMGIAQALYQAGHITYMRTDSVSLSSQAIDGARAMIVSEYGQKYLPEKPNFYKTRSRNAQEAHEAIRPTDFTKKGKDLGLSGADLKLYDMIWRRAVASQMTDRKVERVSIELEPIGAGGNYTFSTGAEIVLFDGFRKALGEAAKSEEEVQEIGNISKGDLYDWVEMLSEQKFTQPKARYTEASLVKALETLGIGRPSTYATIISTVQDRGYVTRDGKSLVPTDVGKVVNKFLVGSFKRLVDYEYTAGVEQRLDDIANGELEYVPFMEDEYKPLVSELEFSDKNVSKEDVVVLGKSDEKCPDCGSEMVIRVGRYGKFLSCSKFPECKGMKNLESSDPLDTEKYEVIEKCPKCGNKMMMKTGKYGKFWACEKYPECKGTVPLLLKEKCPECGKSLVERRSKWGKTFIGCSGYPDCKYIKKEKKKEE